MDAIEKVRAKIKANMKPIVPALKWNRISTVTMESECKRFTVGKLPKGKGFKYEAWMGKTPIAFSLESFEEARLLCESHALNLAKPAPSNAPILMSDQARLAACK